MDTKLQLARSAIGVNLMLDKNLDISAEFISKLFPIFENLIRLPIVNKFASSTLPVGVPTLALLTIPALIFNLFAKVFN